MNKCEIIERLKNIAGYAVHTVGEEPFVMSLDDGIAVHEAIELLKKSETNCSEIPNNSDTISRQQAIDALCSVCNALGGGHNCDKTKFVYNAPFDEQVILCPEHYALTMLPSAQPEHMHAVMLKIAEKYEKAMNTSYILNPMAWALYQTWKEYDR